MDPGTAVGIVSLGIQVCRGILDYYDAWDRYEDDVRQAYQSIAGLKKTFGILEQKLQSIPPGHLPTRVLECLSACTDGLRLLEKKLKKLHEEKPKGVAQKAHSGILRALYPFRASTLEKLKEIVGDLTNHLDLAIQTLLLHQSTETGASVAQIAGNVDGIRTLVADVRKTSLETKDRAESVAAGVQTLLSDTESKRLREVIAWLDAPDRSIDHDEARQKHEPGTGQWFLECQRYQDWLSTPSSRLWLHGKAGCCKTVLCSTIVEDVHRRLSGQTGAVLVYFYFSFADMRKQSYTSLLLSLVSELMKDCFHVHPDLSAAFDRRRSPDIKGLEKALAALLGRYHNSYVIVDALDECPERDDQRERVMQGLERIAKTTGDTRFLITSRKESDIEEFMQTWADVRMAIDEQGVNADIDIFIKAAVVTDPKLKRLPDTVKGEIVNTFHMNSDGMFRWAALQLQSIRSLKIPRRTYISAALRTMPRSLDETYERILASIDETYHEEVRIALQWLTFSAVPLSVAELAEACSIGLENARNQNLLEECNEETVAGLLGVLSPLILVEQLSLEIPDTIEDTIEYPLPEKFSATRRGQRVRLAHFTVKEYLLSNRLQNTPVSQFGLSAYSYYDLAQTCCAYLIKFTNQNDIQQWNEEEKPRMSVYPRNFLDNFRPSYPLLPHAACLWTWYQSVAESQLSIPQSSGSLHLEVIKNERVRVSWLHLCGYDDSYGGPTILHWTALLRFDRTISMLDEQDCRSDVNQIGGPFGTAIQAAAYSGAETTVRFLIDKGADVNIRAGDYGTALTAAASMGHKRIVEILIDAGADGTDGHALMIASALGFEEIVQLLVDNGAHAPPQLGLCDNGLSCACQRRHEKIVQNQLSIEDIVVKMRLSIFDYLHTQNLFEFSYLRRISWECDALRTRVILLLAKGAHLDVQE